MVVGADRSRLLDSLAVPDRPQRYRLAGRWVEAEVLDHRNDPAVEALVVRWRRVDELMAVVEDLAASEARYRSLVQTIPEVVFLVDINGRITSLNEAWERQTGVGAADALGRPLLDFLGEEDRRRVAPVVEALLAGRLATVTLESRCLDTAGDEPRWWEVRARLALGPGGDVLGATGIITDVTDRRRAQDQLTRLSRHDPLTGLLNRSALFEEVQAALDAREDPEATLLAVLSLDLDGFTRVNDRFGHDTGDALLAQAALRIVHAVREADRAGRIGGDEFVVLSPGHVDLDSATTLARRIAGVLATPFDVDGAGVLVSASVGVALAAPGTDGAGSRSATDLVRAADLAMYRAKAHGDGDVQVSPAMLAAAAAAP